MQTIEQKPLLVVIGVTEAARLHSVSLEKALSAIDAEREYRVTEIPLATNEETRGFIVNVEDVQFTVIPNKAFSAVDYTEAVAGSVLNWANAGAGLQSAKSTVILAANRTAVDHALAVKTAFLLSVVSRAVTHLVNTAFVFWGTANHLIEPSAFSAAVDAMLQRNQPPILQWVRFDIFKGPRADGQLTGGMRSTGLADFVGHEVLMEPLPMPPSELARRTIGYADELIRNGPSGVSELEGPISGEIISLKMQSIGMVPTLIMQSNVSTLAEAQ